MTRALLLLMLLATSAGALGHALVLDGHSAIAALWYSTALFAALLLT